MMPASSSPSAHVVGVDLGGTKILAGVFDASLNCLGRAKKKTKAQHGVGAVIERIVECVGEAITTACLTRKDVRAVGIGVPGTVNAKTGHVLFAPNLGWKEVPLAGPLGEFLGAPVF